MASHATGDGGIPPRDAAERGLKRIMTLGGAYAVEVEVIPAELLAEISKRTTLLTSSIGAGSGGDIRFLFAEDILGNDPPPYPRHSKQYRELYKLEERMQAERVSGFREFAADVREGHSPDQSTWSTRRRT